MGSQVLAQVIRISEGIHYVIDFIFLLECVKVKDIVYVEIIVFYSVRMTGSF